MIQLNDDSVRDVNLSSKEIMKLTERIMTNIVISP